MGRCLEPLTKRSPRHQRQQTGAVVRGARTAPSSTLKSLTVWSSSRRACRLPASRRGRHPAACSWKVPLRVSSRSHADIERRAAEDALAVGRHRHRGNAEVPGACVEALAGDAPPSRRMCEPLMMAGRRRHCHRAHVAGIHVVGVLLGVDSVPRRSLHGRTATRRTPSGSAETACTSLSISKVRSRDMPPSSVHSFAGGRTRGRSALRPQHRHRHDVAMCPRSYGSRDAAA